MELYEVGQPMNGTVWTTNTLEWKPIGRGRRFDRLRRGLARRLRIPWVRKTRWERDHPQSNRYGPPYFKSVEYGNPWTSDHCLANFSFACTCHKGERYDRRRGR